MEDNMDLSVLDENVSADLLAYMRDQESQMVDGEEGLVTSPTGDDQGQLGSESAQNALTTTGDEAPQGGVTPDPAQDLLPTMSGLQEPHPAEREAQQLRDILRQQLIAKARAEEQRFLQTVSELPDEERRAAVAERQAVIERNQRVALERQLQAVEIGRVQASEQSAKAQASFIVASRFGLPYDNDTINLLQQAGHPNDMIRTAQYLAKVRGEAQKTTLAQGKPALHPNAQTVGGSAAPATPQPSRVQPRSNDLIGLFRERPYTVGGQPIDQNRGT